MWTMWCFSHEHMGRIRESKCKNKVTSLKLHGTLKMSFVFCKPVLRWLEIRQWMQSIAPNKLLALPVLAEAFLLMWSRGKAICFVE